MPHERYEPWEQDWILRLRRLARQTDDPIPVSFCQRFRGHQIDPVVMKRSRGGCLQKRDIAGDKADDDADDGADGECSRGVQRGPWRRDFFNDWQRLQLVELFPGT